MKNFLNNHSLPILLAAAVLVSCAAGFGGGLAASAFGWTAVSDTIATTTAAPDQTGTTSAAASVSGASQTALKTAAQSGSGTSLTVTEIASLAAPSVVEINTEVQVTGQRMQQYIAEGAGSGVILTEDGFIVTNNHVIADAEKITVRLASGESYAAELIGSDAETDLALLKIAASGLTCATLGDSGDLSVGDLAVAIGNPLGELGGTVTDGIISALDREITIDGENMTLLQTNAAINPGNSGGGLFDASGSLVGIVNAKSSGTDVEGLGFAIPIDIARPVIESLMNYGYVQGRIDLGMTLVDIDSEQTAMLYRVSQLGTYVLKVDAGSSAEMAGFASGDCILAVDGQEVGASADLDGILDQHQVGDTLKFTVYRNRQELTLTMTLAESAPAAA